MLRLEVEDSARRFELHAMDVFGEGLGLQIKIAIIHLRLSTPWLLAAKEATQRMIFQQENVGGVARTKRQCFVRESLA